MLIVLGVLCTIKTSALSTVGGTTYERRRMRRAFGEVLVIAGMLLLGIAALVQSNAQ